LRPSGDTAMAPDAFNRQLSGSSPDGKTTLSVVAKRSYRYDNRGICFLHEDPVPLRDEPVIDDASGELLHDTDLYPHKLKTDVVLHAHAAGAGPERNIRCGIRVGGHEKIITVMGDRRCTVDGTGKLLFSEPAPFVSMPLSYKYAYGGRDEVAHRINGNPLSSLQQYVQPEYDLSDFSLFEYPRNPAGKGYLCHWDRANIEALQLPNLEDPSDPLSPQRLFVERWDRWPTMPLPQGTGWMSHTWFPRMAYLGFVPVCDPS
jgi:hypothetical protein